MVADLREQILARLIVACQGVTGIAAVARNKLDVPGIARPAIIIQDGVDTRSTEAKRSATRYRFAELQMMELHPLIELRLRADTGDEAGSLVSLFRGRVLNAIAGDAELQSLVTTNGAIWLESFAQPEPSPESKEPRLHFEFVFLYPLKRGDLAA